MTVESFESLLGFGAIFGYDPETVRPRDALRYFNRAQRFGKLARRWHTKNHAWGWVFRSGFEAITAYLEGKVDAVPQGHLDDIGMLITSGQEQDGVMLRYDPRNVVLLCEMIVLLHFLKEREHGSHGNGEGHDDSPGGSCGDADGRDNDARRGESDSR